MSTFDEQGLNAADFLGNYLKKEDLDEDMVVEIVEIRAEDIPGSARRKLVAQFAEFEKPLILNATNIKRLAKLYGSKNTAKWRGYITLYVDPDVEYGGKRTGGLRVKRAANGRASRAMEQQGAPADFDEVENI